MTNYNYIKKAILPALFLAAGIAFGQNKLLRKAEAYLYNEAYDSVQQILLDVNTIDFTNAENARRLTLLGNANLALDSHDNAFAFYLEAKSLWKKLDSLQQVANVNLALIETISHQKDSKISSDKFLNEYIEYAQSTNDPNYIAKAYGKLATKFNHADDMVNALKYYDMGIALAYELKDTLQAIGYKFNKGVAFNSDTLQDYTAAIRVFNDSRDYFLKIEHPTYLAYSYNNLGQSYKGLKEYNLALSNFKRADSIKLNRFSLKTREILYENMVELFDTLNDSKNGFIYTKKLLAIRDSIGEDEQNKALAESDRKYRTLEAEQNVLIQEQISSKNKNIALGLGGTLGLGSIIAFLLYRNTKRKQRIAEQEKEIEIQKTEKILKEQELNTIDAMIAGQEKERQRLAGDLHDSVGATLSAAKMQFDHLKKNKGQLKNEEELFASTSDLLEEAYKEVRSMAHAKNSGVIAKNGLLPAVQKLAKNASVTKNLKIEVQDFGLEERLEGAMEIAIFRMIQELVTNIIKHAQASEASISITQHEQSINVMVEDNGKGFKAAQMAHKEGMGLGSIEKRIEHLEGTFEVDSSPGKGTSISIDIPL